tara:strand:- start:94 stop:324 length:231 start_codon:yes stop_codon:yes gene_type:complete
LVLLKERKAEKEEERIGARKEKKERIGFSEEQKNRGRERKNARINKMENSPATRNLTMTTNTSYQLACLLAVVLIS